MEYNRQGYIQLINLIFKECRINFVQRFFLEGNPLYSTYRWFEIKFAHKLLTIVTDNWLLLINSN